MKEPCIYPIENPPNLADTGKKHYICIRNQERNLPVTSFIYEIHISHTICGEIRFVVGDYKKDPNEVEGNDTCPPEQVHSASTFPFSPPTLAFALGLYYLYGRIGFMFHGLECIFHAMERIFQPMECTFRAVEYKTNPTINRL